MKIKCEKLVCVFLAMLFLAVPVKLISAAETEPGEIKPSELYARSAVLMDADSGRILFAKSGQKERPMASTTKIMTCILALEKGDPQDHVSVSGNAAAQPKVKLGMKEGESYILKDLLYSLMLESHNDTAAAIAEHIGGSLRGFADLMNNKAAAIGCMHTYFITPNGLDARDEGGVHHTTAEDLALIMRYCIMESPEKNSFLEITRTPEYSFSDVSRQRSFTCQNHNTFLKMMEGALTGKTGFTADAGYCYVGALRQDDRTFIVALLACGWPNAKGYKWSDTRKLMTYGLENYFYQDVAEETESPQITVRNAVSDSFPEKKEVTINLVPAREPPSVLLREGEQIKVKWDVPKSVLAPVEKGDKLGTLRYSLNGTVLFECPAAAQREVKERTFSLCMSWLSDRFLFGV